MQRAYSKKKCSRIFIQTMQTRLLYPFTNEKFSSTTIPLQQVNKAEKLLKV